MVELNEIIKLETKRDTGESGNGFDFESLPKEKKLDVLERIERYVQKFEKSIRPWRGENPPIDVDTSEEAQRVVFLQAAYKAVLLTLTAAYITAEYPDRAGWSMNTNWNSRDFKFVGINPAQQAQSCLEQAKSIVRQIHAIEKDGDWTELRTQWRYKFERHPLIKSKRKGGLGRVEERILELINMDAIGVRMWKMDNKLYDLQQTAKVVGLLPTYTDPVTYSPDFTL